jgi:peptidyl-prolyl cis-trans isomerase A (cyclophilin A)
MLNRLLANVFSALLLCLPVSAVVAQTDTPALTEVVCLDTTQGEICIRLFPEDAPQTVANFLNYVNGGDFDGTFFHRAVPGFVVQGGGYFFQNAQGPVAIPKDPAVVNEFKRSNLRGTVAMAKIAGDPNSATNEWFFNLVDNSADLDNQNGGFTVFGEVVLDGMTVVDKIVRLGPYDLSSSFGSAFSFVPLQGVDNVFTVEDFVTINRAYVTERDLSAPTTPDDPNADVPTLATYQFNQFAVPVRWTDGRMYRMVLVQTSTPPAYVFEVDTRVIVLLSDKGQEAATFDGQVLTVPSIRVGTRIFTDLQFRLTNPRELEFTLEAYSRYQAP